MKYLLDTFSIPALYLSVITIGEFQKGISKLSNNKRKEEPQS